MDKKLTAKQRKEFLRIWIGSNLFHLDFGFDYTDINDVDIEILQDEKMKIADKFLKSNDAFCETKEIFEYVKKNY